MRRRSIVRVAVLIPLVLSLAGWIAAVAGWQFDLTYCGHRPGEPPSTPGYYTGAGYVGGIFVIYWPEPNNELAGWAWSAERFPAQIKAGFWERVTWANGGTWSFNREPCSELNFDMTFLGFAVLWYSWMKMVLVPWWFVTAVSAFVSWYGFRRTRGRTRSTGFPVEGREE